MYLVWLKTVGESTSFDLNLPILINDIEFARQTRREVGESSYHRIALCVDRKDMRLRLNRQFVAEPVRERDSNVDRT